MRTAIRLLSVAFGTLLLAQGSKGVEPSAVSSRDGITLYSFELGAETRVASAILSLPFQADEASLETTGMVELRFAAGFGVVPTDGIGSKDLESRCFVAADRTTAKVDVSRYLQTASGGTVWIAIRPLDSIGFVAASCTEGATLDLLRLPAVMSKAQLGQNSAGLSRQSQSAGRGSPDTPRAVVAPNPFNPRTTIAFEIASREDVTIDIYAISGGRVWRVDMPDQSPGRHQVQWNGVDHRGKQLASGVYFAVIRGQTWTEKLKLALLR